MRYDSPRHLTAAQQFVNLQTNPICHGEGWLHAGRLVWQYWTRPTTLSRAYALQIEYRQGDYPDTFVTEPDLPLLAEGRKIPHLYQQKPTELCLFQPKKQWEWNPSKLIDQTIVPWAALWLFYFEDWLATGVWNGGGEHPLRRAHGRF